MHACACAYGSGPRERTALEELGRQVGARVDAAVVARELGLVRPRAGLGVGVASRVGVEAGGDLGHLVLDLARVRVRVEHDHLGRYGVG